MIQRKTIRLIDEAYAILSEHKPMTLRQVYYQLVSRQVIKNNRGSYQAVSNALVYARQEGLIPWGWIEDRLRVPRVVSMWDDVPDFVGVASQAYRRDVWATQPGYFEVWLEKDALSGIFEDVLGRYGVTLNVGRGYDGWSSIRNAAQRLNGREATILYFGDFDPSGEDMARSLRDRLGFFGEPPEVRKVALTLEDIKRYNLPPDFAKRTDTRTAAFIEKNGDVSVELDALPVAVLRGRLELEVENLLDLNALAKTRELETRERAAIAQALEAIG